MGFIYIPPSGGGGLPGGGTSANVHLHDDLSSQITGTTDRLFTSENKYTLGSLNIIVGGISGMEEGNHFFEEDPATGEIRFSRILTADDAPVVAQYKY